LQSLNQIERITSMGPEPSDDVFPKGMEAVLGPLVFALIERHHKAPILLEDDLNFVIVSIHCGHPKD
jgi:hypothetical protein